MAFTIRLRLVGIIGLCPRTDVIGAEMLRSTISVVHFEWFRGLKVSIQNLVNWIKALKYLLQTIQVVIM